MGTLASALTEAAASVGVPLAEATPKVHAELDFGDFLARQAAFVQVNPCSMLCLGSEMCCWLNESRLHQPGV